MDGDDAGGETPTPSTSPSAFQHPLVGRSTALSGLGLGYLVLASAVAGAWALGAASGNAVMVVYLGSVAVPLLYGVVNGGPGVAFATSLPVVTVLFVRTGEVGEAAALLVVGFTGAAIGLYTTGVRTTGSVVPAPYPGYTVNLGFVGAALLVAVATLVPALVRYRPTLDPSLMGGPPNVVLTLLVLAVLPLAGVAIVAAYGALWMRERDGRSGEPDPR